MKTIVAAAIVAVALLGSAWFIGHAMTQSALTSAQGTQAAAYTAATAGPVSLPGSSR